MPFLNSTRKTLEHSQPAPSPKVKNAAKNFEDIPPAEDLSNGQLSIFHNPSTPNKTNKQKGTEYEEYVGSLYENKGYAVNYNGIEKGAWDGTIDLICRDKRYTILVQCKCYKSGSVSVCDIYQFYGAFRHYAVHHPAEVVRASFWTTLKVKINSSAFKAITELGITLHDG